MAMIRVRLNYNLSAVLSMEDGASLLKILGQATLIKQVPGRPPQVLEGMEETDISITLVSDHFLHACKLQEAIES